MDEALKELQVPEGANAERKFRACCQWHLGHPDWADTILKWMGQAGYQVSEIPAPPGDE